MIFFISPQFDLNHIISVKIPNTFYVKLDKNTWKCIWKNKGQNKLKAILSNKNNKTELALSDTKIYKAIIIDIILVQGLTNESQSPEKELQYMIKIALKIIKKWVIIQYTKSR